MEIGSAIASLSASLSLARAALETRDAIKINTAIADLNTKYTELSMAGLQLVEKLSALQTALGEAQHENAELKKQLNERSHYVLHELAPGRFVYRYIPNGEGSDPEHYLCQACYDQGVKSVLYLYQVEECISRHYSCPVSGKADHDVYF